MISRLKAAEAENEGRLAAREREQSAEIEVLKEMIKGIKVQLKSKDTDI